MRCFVINLDRSTERMNAFRKDWKAPFGFERVSAIDGDRIIQPFNWRHSARSYALTATYVLIFSKMLQECQSEPFIIFEDDVLLMDNWWDEVKDIEKEIKEEYWMLINLGPFMKNPWPAPEVVSNRVGRMRHFWKTHACIYNPKSLSTLISVLGTYLYTVDQVYNDLILNNGWSNFYCTRNFLAGTRAGSSDMEYGRMWDEFYGWSGLGLPTHPALEYPQL